jgi:TetR/AcrR family transcriptional regulator, transcriptional repressor of bet genes
VYSAAHHTMPQVKRKSFAAPKFVRQSAEARREMLIEAGIACLAKDGILGFTIDRICIEAKVSRGLITHHFKSIDGLLAAVYATMYGKMLAVIENPNVTDDATPEKRLTAIIDAMFSREFFNRESLNIWLALWGEIANNPALLKEHRKQYARYRRGIERALGAVAFARGLKIDTPLVAMMFVSLVDGLGLEWCIEPKLLSARQAREACFKLLEPILGPLQ